MTHLHPSGSDLAEPVTLVVGYPAPAAAEIVGRLLDAGTRIVACVVPRAQWSRATRLHRGALDAGQLRLFAGDAGAPGLGLPHTAWRILDTTDEIYAVASAREIAAGHIQDFADECPRLREMHLFPQTLAEPGAVPSRPAPARRLPTSLSGPLRASRRAVARTVASALALGAAGVARVVPSGLAAGSWNALDIDLNAALSLDDVERDLWPGFRSAA